MTEKLGNEAGWDHGYDCQMYGRCNWPKCNCPYDPDDEEGTVRRRSAPRRAATVTPPSRRPSRGKPLAAKAESAVVTG